MSTTDDTDRLKDQLVKHTERRLREKADEANRDDLGQARERIHDPTNSIVDDHGRRRRREKGISDKEARRRLDELEEHATEPRGGHPNDEPDDEPGDVDPRIQDAVETEGW